VKEKIIRFIKDEKGITTVEAIIITVLLGAGAIMAWSGIRTSTSGGGSVVTKNINNVISSAGNTTFNAWATN
jgi:Flp pilus assembly pilin Flp